MIMRPALGLAAALTSLLPTAALADDSAALRQTILQGCTLQPWQFAVRVESGGTVIPQMSPTLSDAQKKCVQAMIQDYRRNGAS